MDSNLHHMLPDNHQEEVFADIIKSIPKSIEDHKENLEYLKARAEKGWRVKRILDVGCGEGTFTEVALQLLELSGALSDDFELHLMEKNEKLKNICIETLTGGNARESDPHRFQIALNQKKGNASFLAGRGDDSIKLEENTFSDDEGNLRNRVESLRDTYGTYDLIIASHVSYYFEGNGSEAAYLISSRLLKKTERPDIGGCAWFVIRDRDCPFYKCRRQILFKHQLPDINFDCFSDAFLDQLYSLLPSVSNQGPDEVIFSQKRKLRLKFSDDIQKSKMVVEYLYWLKNIPQVDLELAVDTARATENFSETHVWINAIQPIERELEREHIKTSRMLAQSIASMRKYIPDLMVHRAVLAFIDPSGKPNDDSLSTIDQLDKPLIYDSFEVTSHGYAFGSGNEADTLDEFFKKNLSFLFYPGFYFDTANIDPTSEEGVIVDDLSSVDCMDGAPLNPTNLSNYSSRITYTGQTINVDTSQHNKNQIFTLDESLQRWYDILSKSYCDPAEEDAESRMWSFNIGCNLFPELRVNYSEMPFMNTSCACFLLISSTNDLSAFKQPIVGEIKTVMVQYIGRRLYSLVLNREKQIKEVEKKIARNIMHETNANLGTVRGKSVRLKNDFTRFYGTIRESSGPLRNDEILSRLETFKNRFSKMDQQLLSVQNTISWYFHMMSGHRKIEAQEEITLARGLELGFAKLFTESTTDYVVNEPDAQKWQIKLRVWESYLENTLAVLLRNALSHKCDDSPVQVDLLELPDDKYELKWRNAANPHDVKRVQDIASHANVGQQFMYDVAKNVLNTDITLKTGESGGQTFVDTSIILERNTNDSNLFFISKNQ